MIWVIFIVRTLGRHGGWRRPPRASLSLITAASVLYLLFLALWGLNYDGFHSRPRSPTTDLVSPAMPFFLWRDRGERVNALQSSTEEVRRCRSAREYAFAGAQRRNSSERRGCHGGAAESGRWSPGFLTAVKFDEDDPLPSEIILNPGVSVASITLAHEWRTSRDCRRGRPTSSRGSRVCGGRRERSTAGWLEAFRYAVAALPETSGDLHGGSRLVSSPILRAINTGWDVRIRPSAFRGNVYESYLRAQGVDAGNRKLRRDAAPHGGDDAREWLGSRLR